MLKRFGLVVLWTVGVTAVSAPTVSGQDPGYALRFDGVSDFVRLPTTATVMGAGWESSKTASLWVNPTGTASCTGTDPSVCDLVFGDRPRTWGISRGTLGGLDRIWVWNFDGTIDRVGIDYTPGQWIQVALVHGGGLLRAYKNGVLVGSVSSGATPASAGGYTLQAGGAISNATLNWTFRGEIDELQVWNVARSGADIALDWALPLTGAETGLMAYYRMSNGSGTSVTDDSGHGRTGTLVDGATGVPADGPIQWVPSGAFAGSPNSPPVADAQSVTTPEDTALGITLSGSDPDTDPLTFRVVTQPTHGTLTGTAPNLLYTPLPNVSGGDSFTFVVNDGHVDSPAATVSVTILPVNDPPLAVPQSLTTPRDVALDIALTGSDPDSDPVTFRVVTQPTLGTLSGTAPNLLYTPLPSVSGSDSFSFVVNDGQVDSPATTVSVTIGNTGANNPPVAVPQSLTTPEDVALDIALTGSDPDSDPVQFRVVTQPTLGTLSGTAPNLVYTPLPNVNGSDSFSFVVNDGQVDSPAATVSVTILPANDPPVAVPQSVTTPEDVALAIALTGSDPDTDPLTFQVVTQPTHGTLSGTAPNLVYTPLPNVNGSDSFSFVVNDGQVDSPAATVSVTILPVNNPPVANPQSLNTLEDVALDIALTGSDPDTDPVTFRVVTQPTHGTLSGTAPNLVYTPLPNVSGSDGFTFVVNDGQVDSPAATVSVSILPANDPPVAGNDAASTRVETPVVIQVLANDSDIDGDALTITDAGAPTNGVAVNNGTSIVYTPLPGFAGTDSFAYTVSDGNGGFANAQVTVTVSFTEDPGFALAFNGISNFASINTTASVMGPGWQTTKTISLWVRAKGPAQCRIAAIAECDSIFGDRPQWWGINIGTVYGLNRIWVSNWDGNLDYIGIPYSIGEWMQITMVHSGGVLRAYKNGVLVGSVPSGATRQPNTGGQPVLTFGGIIMGKANYSFDGDIDELRIFNIARTQQEILDDMNRHLLGTETGLMAYYRMSNGSGTNVTDDSGHGWNAKLWDGYQQVPAAGPVLWVPSGAFSALP